MPRKKDKAKDKEKDKENKQCLANTQKFNQCKNLTSSKNNNGLCACHKKSVKSYKYDEETNTYIKLEGIVKKDTKESQKKEKKEINKLNKITNIKDLIKSYDNNHNTGVKYEISAGIEILIIGKLDKKDNIPKKYKSDINLYKTNIFNDIKGIYNLSQRDNCGGTGDIGIEYPNGIIDYYSITKWTNEKEKCMCNPTPKKYGIIKEDYKEIIKTSHEKSLEYRKKNKGEKPNKKWKEVRNDPYAKQICKTIATDASNNWNVKKCDDKKEILLSFIDINKNKQPNTKGIIYSTETGIKIIKSWKYKKNIDNCLNTISNGIFIYHCTNINDYENTWFLKTQVKYNNGIIELPTKKASEKDWDNYKIKQSHPCSSWNVTCKLERLFDMKKI
jgi:hypothetical protein